MTSTYRYELWNGKKSIGEVVLMNPVVGKSLVVPALSPLKQPYGRKMETITLPISYRQLSDDGVDFTVRRVLDVRKKSKRQIAVIKSVLTGLI